MDNSQQLSRVRRNSDALLIISVVAVWWALLGPVWTYVPATATTPATTMTFADLAAANALNPSGLQVAFYQWVAWAFAGVTTITALVVLRFGRRVTGAGCALIGLLQLLVTVFVTVKAAPDLSVLLSGLKYTRLGTVLFLGSMLTLAVAGFQRLRYAQPVTEPKLVAARA
ncbi:hypothetical protein NONO_c43990 [Nocardia nova SH22a]|uniref:Transmembrane protein n=1 Tax=Nocardia nova SH22a TaxID=1415166 RepID=W5TJM3_9NOCA|nr:hypothetical protein [Nocardia nova]AHH19183.1 hypothetical protein NONO_c43990 [Nocardia nova SH22a]